MRVYNVVYTDECGMCELTEKRILSWDICKGEWRKICLLKYCTSFICVMISIHELKFL